MCKNGMIIPAWTPSINSGTGNVVIQGVIYLIALIYIFVGMSIIGDRLMAAVEVITSKEKQLAIKKPNGVTQIISVRIWNETVSNLTIMALGSSAPVILLPIIEVIGHFQVGDLGLGTIVGSAAFNMFVIIAICVWVIPNDENRKIKNLPVFIVTIIWSVFAYIWLNFILIWSSPAVIEVWEGIVTLVFFPITVLSAYIADHKLFIYKFFPKKCCMNKKGFIVGDEESGDPIGVIEMRNPNHSGERKGMTANDPKFFEEENIAYATEFEQLRQKYILLLRGLKRKNPKKSMRELELMARKEILDWSPKSRAFYRLQATKKRNGGRYIIKNRIPVAYGCCASEEDNILNLTNPSIATVMNLQDDHYGVFGFPNTSQNVPESVGEFRLWVYRSTGVRGRVILPFRTLEGSAKLERDYRLVEGMLLFENNENEKDILIQIVDKESYERDSIFYVELGEPRIEEDYLKQSDHPVFDRNDDSTDTENISQLANPRLAKNYKIQLRIKENKEFKNAVDNLLEKASASVTIGTSTWKEQFLDAITVSTGDDENQRACSCSNYVIHFFTIFWKLLFAFVPPTNCLGGWACFITSFIVIGVLTALLCDLVFHLGCTVGLRDSVTAILLVPIGINVPDIFASKIAAQNDKYADSSIGNVMCSIPVNAFLGIGLSWSIVAVYHAYFNRSFFIHPGTLYFSSTLFAFCAFVSSIVLLLRRISLIGGELGGPMRYKIPTVILFVGLWFFFVIASILKAYEFTQGF